MIFTVILSKCISCFSLNFATLQLCERKKITTMNSKKAQSPQRVIRKKTKEKKNLCVFAALREQKNKH